MRSDRGTNGTYDNATSAGTRNEGGSTGVGPSSSNESVPNNSNRVPARDTSNTGSDAGSRIDGRVGPGVGNGNADTTTGVNNAPAGINGGAGDKMPEKPGISSGNADTSTGVDNVRPGNVGTDAPATPKAIPSDKTDNAAGVGSSDADTAAGTNSGQGDVKK